MLTYISLCDVNIYICESRNYLDYHLNTFLFARLCLRLPLPGSGIFLFFFLRFGKCCGVGERYGSRERARRLIAHLISVIGTEWREAVLLVREQIL